MHAESFRIDAMKISATHVCSIFPEGQYGRSAMCFFFRALAPPPPPLLFARALSCYFLPHVEKKVKSVAALQRPNGVGNACVLLALVLVVLAACTQLSENGPADGLRAVVPEKAYLFLGTCVFAFEVPNLTECTRISV